MMNIDNNDQSNKDKTKIKLTRSDSTKKIYEDEVIEPLDKDEPILGYNNHHEIFPEAKAMVFWELLNEAFNEMSNYDDNEIVTKAFAKCDCFVNKHPFTSVQLVSLISHAHKALSSSEAQDNAFKRLDNDPKQKALAEIEKHYEENKTQFKRRGYGAEFIRTMHNRYPIITSIKTIENLVADLNKENELIPR